MDIREREITGATEGVSVGQYVGGEPTSSGQGVEALKDIVFGSVCTIQFLHHWLANLSETCPY